MPENKRAAAQARKAWRMKRQSRMASDAFQIGQTLHRYARGVDRDDWELLRSCYTADAIDEHGRYNGPVDGLIAWLMVEMKRYESSMHVVANCVIHVDRPKAWSETYCVAYHRLLPDEQGRQTDRTVGVRYLDELRREGREWRISHRRCVYEWVRHDPVPAQSQLSPEYVRGRRELKDLSYPFPLGKTEGRDAR